MVEGRVIAVISGQGGIGKTFVACSLACALAERSATQAVILDLDVDNGYVQGAMNMASEHDVTKLLVGVRDGSALNDLLIPGPANTLVAASPIRPPSERAELASLVPELFSRLRRHFQYSVVDTANQWDAIRQSAIGAADRVVLLSDLTVVGLYSTRHTLGMLEEIALAGRVHLVVRDRGDSSVDHDAFTRIVGRRPSVTVAHDVRAVTYSMMAGLPLAKSPEYAALQHSVDQLADLVS